MTVLLLFANRTVSAFTKGEDALTALRDTQCTFHVALVEVRISAVSLCSWLRLSDFDVSSWCCRSRASSSGSGFACGIEHYLANGPYSVQAMTGDGLDGFKILEAARHLPTICE